MELKMLRDFVGSLGIKGDGRFMDSVFITFLGVLWLSLGCFLRLLHLLLVLMDEVLHFRWVFQDHHKFS